MLYTWEYQTDGVSCLLTSFQHYFGYTSWYFLFFPSHHIPVWFSHTQTFITFLARFSLLRALLPARCLFVVFHVLSSLSKTVKREFHRRNAWGFALEISKLGNYFTITAGGRNTCWSFRPLNLFIFCILEQVSKGRNKYFEVFWLRVKKTKKSYELKRKDQ